MEDPIVPHQDYPTVVTIERTYNLQDLTRGEVIDLVNGLYAIRKTLGPAEKEKRRIDINTKDDKAYTIQNLTEEKMRNLVNGLHKIDKVSGSAARKIKEQTGFSRGQ